MNDDSEKWRQAFLAVVETGSFTGGARAIGRDASVVSRHVAALETRLGIRLLERSTRRVATTEAGALYYAKISQAMQLINAAEKEAQTLASAPSGLLRIALPTAFGRRWIAPLLPAFLKLHPAVQIVSSYADRYVDLIAEQVDVAVRIGDMTDSRLFRRLLAPTRRVLCAAPAYLRDVAPLQQLDDLRRVDCLMFTPMSTHPVWHFARARQTRAVHVTGRMASDDIDSLIDAALAGCGVLMAADWLVADELADGRLIEVLPDWHPAGESGVYLMRPSRDHESAKVRVFSAWLTSQFATPSWLPR
jgi:DNA-binding transcriptional LysR family regulator